MDVVRAVRALRMPREFGFVQGEVSGGRGYGASTVRGRTYRRSLERPCIFVRAVPRVCRPRAVRDFRGALVGRAGRGLFVTTGSFTTEATREARRDGAAPIDRLDGDQLADKLKERRLGVRTELVESMEIDSDWFQSL